MTNCESCNTRLKTASEIEKENSLVGKKLRTLLKPKLTQLSAFEFIFFGKGLLTMGTMMTTLLLWTACFNAYTGVESLAVDWRYYYSETLFFAKLSTALLICMLINNVMGAKIEHARRLSSHESKMKKYQTVSYCTSCKEINLENQKANIKDIGLVDFVL